MKNIDYIEVLTRGEGKRAQTAWYWDHGKEWECQKLGSDLLLDTFFIHSSNKFNDHHLFTEPRETHVRPLLVPQSQPSFNDTIHSRYSSLQRRRPIASIYKRRSLRQPWWPSHVAVISPSQSLRVPGSLLCCLPSQISSLSLRLSLTISYESG